MIIRRHLLVAIAAIAASAGPLAAQRRLPVDDSLGVSAGIVSRLLWRGVTLSDAAGLETGASVPLSSLVRGLQLEARGWTSLSDRDRFESGDQYSAALHYQVPFRGAPHPASVTLRVAEYWNPNIDRIAPGEPKHAEELGARGIVDVGIESLGIRTLRLELDAARQVGTRKATWLSAGASMSAGTVFDRVETVHTVAAVLRAIGRAGDMTGPAGTSVAGFGFQALDLGLDLEHRLSGPLRSYSLSSTLRFGMLARPEQRGATVGWVGLRESLVFF